MTRRQVQPSPEQLLILVERAAARKLLPAEAVLLRQALDRGAEALRSLGGTQAALRRSQEALRAAEDELAVRRAHRPAVGALDVVCPRCSAEVQRRCTEGGYGRQARVPHKERVQAGLLGLVPEATGTPP